MIKKIDNLGRVVVPKGYRNMMGLKPGDPLSIEYDSGRIMISAHKDSCTFCGSLDDGATHQGKHICRGCLEELRSSAVY